MGLSRTVFETNGDFGRKKRKKILTPVYLTPPLRGFPLEFCIGGSAQKTPVSCFYKNSLTIYCMYSHLDAIPECDGQTDKQTDEFAITVTRDKMDCNKKTRRAQARAHTFDNG